MKTASHAWLDKGLARSEETGGRRQHLPFIISQIKSVFSATLLHVCLIVFSFLRAVQRPAAAVNG